MHCQAVSVILGIDLQYHIIHCPIKYTIDQLVRPNDVKYCQFGGMKTNHTCNTT